MEGDHAQKSNGYACIQMHTDSIVILDGGLTSTYCTLRLYKTDTTSSAPSSMVFCRFSFPRVVNELTQGEEN